MRSGKVPHAIEEDALDTYFVLLADHSYNASTFAARVAASTRADIYASMTAALATLQGDLHGGAATRRVSDARRRQDAGERRAVRARHPRPRTANHGHGPPRVQGARSARAPSRSDGEEALRSRRRRRAAGTRSANAVEEASRKVLQETQARQHDLRQRRLLHRAGARRPRCSRRRVHVSVRVRAHRRMERARPRAARRQPPHSPAGDVRRPATGPYVPIEQRAANGVRG